VSGRCGGPPEESWPDRSWPRLSGRRGLCEVVRKSRTEAFGIALHQDASGSPAELRSSSDAQASAQRLGERRARPGGLRANRELGKHLEHPVRMLSQVYVGPSTTWLPLRPRRAREGCDGGRLRRGPDAGRGSASIPSSAGWRPARTRPRWRPSCAWRACLRA